MGILRIHLPMVLDEHTPAKVARARLDLEWGGLGENAKVESRFMNISKTRAR